MTHQRGVTLIELLVAMFIISILAMVGLPAYSDYQVRAKLSEDMATIHKVKLLVAEFYSLTGTMPETNKQLGMDKAKKLKGVYLKKLKIAKNPAPGTIKAFYDNDVFPQLEGNNRIDFVPTPTTTGRLVWSCTRGNLSDRYRPSVCRD